MVWPGAYWAEQNRSLSRFERHRSHLIGKLEFGMGMRMEAAKFDAAHNGIKKRVYRRPPAACYANAALPLGI